MLLTVENWWNHKREGREYAVMLDGVDITKGCITANDTGGWALVFEVDANGRYFCRGNEVAKSIRVGRVQFIDLNDRTRRGIDLEGSRPGS